VQSVDLIIADIPWLITMDPGRRIIRDAAVTVDGGKVVAVGNGKVSEEGKRIALDVKAGDKILFGKYSGSEVKLDDKEYLIMREEDVLAILE